MKKLKILLVLSLMFFLLVFSIINVNACSNMNFGKDTTVDGSVIVAGNQEGWASPNIYVIPGQTFKKGAMAPVYLNRFMESTPEAPNPVIKVGEIPQVEKTYTYFHSGFPFMNEHQVFISDELLLGRPELENVSGMMDTDQLMEFALQRAKTAREAIMVAGSLAEKYGYSANYGGPESWSVTDPNEAWWFEVFGGGADWTPDCGRPGAVWVAQRVPDDEVSFNFNRSRIGEIDLENKDYFMGSPNVYSLAEDMGWWDPKSGKPFVWYEVYAEGKSLIGGNPNPAVELREWRFVSLVAPSLNPDPNQERWPFSIKPDKKFSVQDIMAIQKDVYEGTEFDQTKGLVAGPWGSPDRPGGSHGQMGGAPRVIANMIATYHLVAQARNWLPDPIGGLMWFGYDKPPTSCEMPLYCGITKVPDSFINQKRDLKDSNVFDKKSAYWAFEFVSNWANLNYNHIVRDIREARSYLMDDMFAVQPAIEATALELYKKDPSLAVRYLTDYSVNTANKVVDYWWNLAGLLVAKYFDGNMVGEKPPAYPDWWIEEVTK